METRIAVSAIGFMLLAILGGFVMGDVMDDAGRLGLDLRGRFLLGLATEAGCFVFSVVVVWMTG